MSKGSKRRPQQVDEWVAARRWAFTFGGTFTDPCGCEWYIPPGPPTRFGTMTPCTEHEDPEPDPTCSGPQVVVDQTLTEG